MFQASKAHGSRVLWRRTLLLPRTTANVPSFESTWVACPMASDSATALFTKELQRQKQRNGRTANNKEVSHGMQGHKNKRLFIAEAKRSLLRGGRASTRVHPIMRVCGDSLARRKRPKDESADDNGHYDPQHTKDFPASW